MRLSRFPWQTGWKHFGRWVKTPQMKPDTTGAPPNRIRGTEHPHILLWIVKDTCWAQDYRGLGVGMILLTIAVGK